MQTITGQGGCKSDTYTAGFIVVGLVHVLVSDQTKLLHRPTKHWLVIIAGRKDPELECMTGGCAVSQHLGINNLYQENQTPIP